MANKTLILTAIIIGINCHAISQISETTDRDTSEHTQYEINENAINTYAHVDSLLTEIIAQVKKEFSDTSRYDNKILKIFNNSQKEWKDYRDSYCKIYEAMFEGGSEVQDDVSECLTRLTLARIDELKILLGNP